MLRKTEERPLNVCLPEKMRLGIQVLNEAFGYAQDLNSDRWEFAISIQHLESLGVFEHDLRWLVRKGYIEHAREVTVHGDDGRQFRPTGDLTFCETTCVILTSHGASLACSAQGNQKEYESFETTTLGANDGHADSFCIPEWDRNSRRLRLRGVLVKWFKWQAANQEAVLNAFQEDGWPSRIDDPLRPHPEQDSKRRLSDTIKGLNKKQANELIRFHGDGTGEGIVWERIERTR